MSKYDHFPVGALRGDDLDKPAPKKIYYVTDGRFNDEHTVMVQGEQELRCQGKDTLSNPRLGYYSDVYFFANFWHAFAYLNKCATNKVEARRRDDDK